MKIPFQQSQTQPTLDQQIQWGSWMNTSLSRLSTECGVSMNYNDVLTLSVLEMMREDRTQRAIETGMPIPPSYEELDLIRKRGFSMIS